MTPILKGLTTTKKKFHLNWDEFLVQYKDSQITLRLTTKKRQLIVDEKGTLVATAPIHIEEDSKILDTSAQKVLSDIIAENAELVDKFKKYETGIEGHNNPQSEGNDRLIPMTRPQETPKKTREKKTPLETPKKTREKKKKRRYYYQRSSFFWKYVGYWVNSRRNTKERI